MLIGRCFGWGGREKGWLCKLYKLTRIRGAGGEKELFDFRPSCVNALLKSGGEGKLKKQMKKEI